MLDLKNICLENPSQWEKQGIKLPKFKIDALCKETKNNPKWVHIGPGNIFRAFIASAMQKVIDAGESHSGIVVVSIFDHQILDMVYKPYNNLFLKVIMNSDGTLDKTVVASICEALKVEEHSPEEWVKLKEIFSNPELQIVSFTITEKGYKIKNIDDSYIDEVLDDFENGVGMPKNGMSIVTALMYERFKAGKHPIALVSMDNFSHNGDRLFASVFEIAKEWYIRGHVEKEFLDFLSDKGRVSFPWSMIDKITPRPSETVGLELQKLGFENVDIFVTDCNTYIAPFVNAEKPEYLVIEDCFPNGRPKLELAGIYFSDKDIVDKIERMKVCTCLNPLHTALAIFGCLLGYTSISEEMKDPVLVELIKKIGYSEGMPVVVDPKIIEPSAFLKEVIEERFPNPYIPDSPQRIVTDTSQKLGIRFGETIKLYIQRENLDVSSLKYIPLAIAGWCRYLMGINDNGQIMELSPDPLMNELKENISKIEFENIDSVGENLRPILSNHHIFGMDLYETVIGEKIEQYFFNMIKGKNSVKKTLYKEVLGGDI